MDPAQLVPEPAIAPVADSASKRLDGLPRGQ